MGAMSDAPEAEAEEDSTTLNVLSANSSSSSNTSLPPFLQSSCASFCCHLYNCYDSMTGTVSITTFTIISVLTLLPFCITALYLGLQRWWQQGSSVTMSHSDHFTYQMVIIELLSIAGLTLTCCGVYTHLPQMMTGGVYLFVFCTSAQTLLHILTCVEHYLAVVHPIIFLSLRKAKGIRVRNVTTGCAWLLCFSATSLIIDSRSHVFIIIFTLSLVFELIIVSFCSLCVLCALNRPGPGEQVGGRQQVDQSKSRAFYTIMAILGVLVLRLGVQLVATVMGASPQLGETEQCMVLMSVLWFSLPSSLVLPLLFLQKAGKLMCCNNNRL